MFLFRCPPLVDAIGPSALRSNQGPISLATYMRQCLTSMETGYYTSSQPGKDQFGRKGDFITSPEISQVFGELVGVWMVAEWMAQGRASKGVELVEVGPGRGTLMDDMLRTIHNFRPFASSIEAVYLVEASASLREAQKKLLCGDAPMEETATGFQSRSKHGGVPVAWCEDIRYVPKESGRSPFIVAHEFFDALPIHAFQSVVAPSQPAAIASAASGPPRRASDAAHQWRELLVTAADPPLSYTLTSAPPPEFALALSKSPTPHSLLLPSLSPRYDALKDLPGPGATIEISPESLSYASEFARRIGLSKSGAALILDYGPSSTVPINSLRGIRAHGAVSPFSSPGLVDLSADVDFTGLAEAALNASPAVEVHGPVPQAAFLGAMGIRERAEQLFRGVPSEDEEKRRRLEAGWKRLVDTGPGGGMGRVYKAMAIVPLSGTTAGQPARRPVGFGGTVGSA
ncbi:MAG: hypothetical protein M1832_003581 [Thelocarpon impressellum]|nr:MAG: hypothetical protein M1832_003581 [Thelocarpon impressellum]